VDVAQGRVGVTDMRRNKRQKGGRGRPKGRLQARLVSLLVLGGIGCLISGWHTEALRSTEISAAEAVALRFPETWRDVSPSPQAPIAAAAAPSAAAETQFALLNPEPMVPPAILPQAILSPAELPQSRPQAGAPAAGLTAAAPAAKARPVTQTRAVALATQRREVNRPGYMLNDAQIASIKARLNLTPDQEQMWPAVEAALRNIAYTHTQEARGGATAATSAQAAAVDPGAVQGLKSAAVPLIMSFNSEQKEEVRNLVHVMGLDQLASQF
jgi:hypothetical protein